MSTKFKKSDYSIKLHFEFNKNKSNDSSHKTDKSSKIMDFLNYSIKIVKKLLILAGCIGSLIMAIKELIIIIPSSL